MAHRTHYPLECAKSDMVWLTAKLTGGGAAADMVNAESSNLGGGEISACVYASSTGVYTVTFRNKYPELKMAPLVTVSGASSTAGLSGQFTEIDVAAGTGTLKMYVGNTLTDAATADTVWITWAVRNSGKNA